jgi:hypothetical protein
MSDQTAAVTAAPAPDKPVAASLDEWVSAATHYPLLPSGKRVGIKIPDLPALIEAGQIPQHLLDVALGMAGAAPEDNKPTMEMIKTQREFTDVLVQLTVVEPALSDETVKRIPFEDKDFLVAVATRNRDLDAEGEHLAGLMKSEKFRRFRRLGEFNEDVAGL